MIPFTHNDHRHEVTQPKGPPLQHGHNHGNWSKALGVWATKTEHSKQMVTESECCQTDLNFPPKKRGKHVDVFFLDLKKVWQIKSLQTIKDILLVGTNFQALQQKQLIDAWSSNFIKFISGWVCNLEPKQDFVPCKNTGSECIGLRLRGFNMLSFLSGILYDFPSNHHLVLIYTCARSHKSPYISRDRLSSYPILSNRNPFLARHITPPI